MLVRLDNYLQEADISRRKASTADPRDVSTNPSLQCCKIKLELMPMNVSMIYPNRRVNNSLFLAVA